MSEREPTLPQRSAAAASVWTDRLSWAIVPIVLDAARRYGRVTLCYTGECRGSRMARKWLTATGRVSSIHRVAFTRHGERVDDRASAAFLIQARINDCIEGIIQRHRRHWERMSSPDPRVGRERVTASLRAAAAEEIYHLLVLVESARYWQVRWQQPRQRLVVISPSAILANEAPAGWAGSDVEFHVSWSWRHSRLLWLAGSVFEWLKETVHRRRPVATGPSTVATTARFAGLNRQAFLDDLYWWWDSGLPTECVILCFDRADRPATAEIVTEAHRLGIRCVALNAEGAGKFPHLLWKGGPGVRMAGVRFGRKLRAISSSVSQGIMGRWIACRLAELLSKAAKIEDVLTAFHIRAFFHYQDVGLDYISVACDAAGAARFGDQWSNYHWPSACHTRVHHAYFAWGPAYAQRLGASSWSCINQVVVTGCPIRGVRPDPEDAKRSLQLRAAIEARGATRVLALFDTSLPCEKFYAFFLTQLLDDPRWGMVLKPKDGLSWLFDLQPDLEGLYARAQATGRLHVADQLCSPAEIAAAADLCVGVDINTATIVAALGGHRAIHLDYVRLHASPLSSWAEFHRAGPDRLVFDDPVRLWSALNRWYDDPSTCEGLGLADENLLRRIDPFRDGQAGQRIGQYVRWYLDAMDRGAGRDDALEAASQRYARQWGGSMVGAGPDHGHPRPSMTDHHPAVTNVGCATTGVARDP